MKENCGKKKHNIVKAVKVNHTAQDISRKNVESKQESNHFVDSLRNDTEECIRFVSTMDDEKREKAAELFQQFKDRFKFAMTFGGDETDYEDVEERAKEDNSSVCSDLDELQSSVSGVVPSSSTSSTGNIFSTQFSSINSPLSRRTSSPLPVIPKASSDNTVTVCNLILPNKDNGENNADDNDESIQQIADSKVFSDSDIGHSGEIEIVDNTKQIVDGVEFVDGVVVGWWNRDEFYAKRREKKEVEALAYTSKKEERQSNLIMDGATTVSDETPVSTLPSRSGTIENLIKSSSSTDEIQNCKSTRRKPISPVRHSVVEIVSHCYTKSTTDAVDTSMYGPNCYESPRVIHIENSSSKLEPSLNSNPLEISSACESSQTSGKCRSLDDKRKRTENKKSNTKCKKKRMSIIPGSDTESEVEVESVKEVNGSSLMAFRGWIKYPITYANLKNKVDRLKEYKQELKPCTITLICKNNEPMNEQKLNKVLPEAYLKDCKNKIKKFQAQCKKKKKILAGSKSSAKRSGYELKDIACIIPDTLVISGETVDLMQEWFRVSYNVARMTRCIAWITILSANKDTQFSDDDKKKLLKKLNTIKLDHNWEELYYFVGRSDISYACIVKSVEVMINKNEGIKMMDVSFENKRNRQTICLDTKTFRNTLNESCSTILIPVLVRRDHWCGIVIQKKTKIVHTLDTLPEHTAGLFEDFVTKVLGNAGPKYKQRKCRALKQTDIYNCGILLLLFFEMHIRRLRAPKVTEDYLKNTRAKYMLMCLDKD